MPFRSRHAARRRPPASRRPSWAPRARRAAGAVVALGAVVVATVGSSATASPTGYYTVPYSPDIYLHQHNARTGMTQLTRLDPSAWAAAGHPTPAVAPTEYVRPSWSHQVYAHTVLDPSSVLLRHLSLAEWQRAGGPQPKPVGHVTGTWYVKASWSPDIWALLSGELHRLTASEWAAAGHPAPSRQLGVYTRLSWHDAMALPWLGERTLVPTTLSFEGWAQLGYPQPIVAPMLPGDEVCNVGSDLYYLGHTFVGHLTPAQWAAAGHPGPTATCDPADLPALG